MPLHRENERLAGRQDLRKTEDSLTLATGTLACPACDAPVLPRAGGVSPRDLMSCGFCLHGAPVRDFLSLGQPTRPTRVVVRVRYAVAGL